MEKISETIERRRKLLLAVLKKEIGMTLGEIRARATMDYYVIKFTLEDMEKEGYVRKERHGAKILWRKIK